MKAKFSLMLLIPMLFACSTDPGTNKFDDAIDLGQLGTKSCNAVPFQNDDAHVIIPYLYKIEVQNPITFNAEDYKAFCVTVIDSDASYENYTAHVDFVFYDSEYKEIPTISYGNFMVKYEGYPQEEIGDIGRGCALVEGDIAPGTYYFSITLREEAQNDHYDAWVADTLGD